MDQQTNTAQATAPAAVVPPVAGNTPKVSTGGEKASFWQRLAAFFIDVIILTILSAFIGGIFGGFNFSEGSVSFGSGPTLIMWLYFIVMDVKFGQTVGKMVLKIRVQDKDTGANLTWLNAFLREVIGRFLASLVLLLGYFWMLWDKDKQGWHDKLAKSAVVKVK